MTTSFHDHWFGLPMAERDAVAARAKTTCAYMEKLAGGFALPSLRMATRITRAAAHPDIDPGSFVIDYERRYGPIA